jgi:hypothetical protein
MNFLDRAEELMWAILDQCKIYRDVALTINRCR